jgi:hypothetical protein
MVGCLREKYPQVPLAKCKTCGEPGIQSTCQACKLKKRVKID